MYLCFPDIQASESDTKDRSDTEDGPTKTTDEEEEDEEEDEDDDDDEEEEDDSDDEDVDEDDFDEEEEDEDEEEGEEGPFMQTGEKEEVSNSLHIKCVLQSGSK